MSLYRAVWPVLDDTLTLDALKAEALAYLPDMLAAEGAILVSEPRWDTCERGDRLYLTAECDVLGDADLAESRRRELVEAAWSA